MNRKANRKVRVAAAISTAWVALVMRIWSLPYAACDIKNTLIVDDSRPMILFQRFGFDEDGHVSVWAEQVYWRSKRVDAPSQDLNPSSMGFFLVRDASFPRILNESEYTDGFCVLSSHFVKVIFRFPHHPTSFNGSFNGSLLIPPPEIDEYNLIFGNCQPEFQVSMKVHTQMYNVRGGRKDYLPAGQTPLPKMYFFFFLVYAAFFGVWLYACMGRAQTLRKIHVVMAALLLFKALKTICASEDKMYVRKTGTPHGWDVAFYVFGFFKGVVLFTVIVLIGTGWTFLKPYLQPREKKVLMTVIPLQVLENIASAVIGETGPATKDWLAWTQLFLLIDSVCCCAVFFPIVWSIRSLREASNIDGKTAKNLEKLTLFKQLYVVVVAYLYFTRIVVLAMGALVSYKYEWITAAAAEAASFAFYLFIFYNFQPNPRNPYLLVDDQEEATAGQILEAESEAGAGAEVDRPFRL